VAKSITIQELQRAKDEWMCNTLNELYDEMELWQWNAVQHNRWARALKASNQVGVRPMWYRDELGDGEKKLSWATATRALRKLKARIIKVGGKREQPKEQAWRLEDDAQLELLFRGEEVLAAPGPLLTPPPSSSPPKTPFWSYSEKFCSEWGAESTPARRWPPRGLWLAYPLRCRGY